MAIKEIITLEGVEQVKSQLKDLGNTGETELKRFTQIGGGDVNPFDSLVKNAKDAGLSLSDVEKHSNSLREAIHVLHPILQIAGVRMGELGSFARLAGASIGALAVATGGAVAVGVGLLEEKVALLKAQLSDITGSSTAGEAAFNKLQQSAKAFGTTVDAIAPGFTALKRGLDDFAQSTQGFKFVAFKPEDLPGAQNLEKITQATENFFKILRAGRLDSTDAAKAATEFFKAVGAGGQLTAETLKQLPIGTIQLLAQAMGKGIISVSQFTAEVAKTPIPINRLTEALARFGPQADQAFDSKAIISMGDAFNKLIGTFSDFAKSVSGLSISDTIVKQIELFRTGFVQAVAQVDAFITKVKEVGSIKFLGTPLLTIEFDKPKNEKEAEKAGLESAENVKKGFRTVKSEPVPLADIVTIETGGIADTFLKQLKDDLRAGAIIEPPPAIDFSQALSSVDTFTQTFLQKVQATWAAIQTLVSQPLVISWQFSSNPFLAQQPLELATGGIVRGAGSTTSDSILALLSNREFVVNARAVSHYGPDLFAALNAMRLPRDFINRFSMGGLARSLGGNRFAAGGQVRSGNPVVLKIDRQSFNMTAGDDTITQLKRFAVTAQLSSSGRKPRWVR